MQTEGGRFKSLPRYFRRGHSHENKEENSDEIESSLSASVMFEPPPLTPIVLRGYKQATKTRLMNTEIAEELRTLLPSRLQLHDEWNLVYSLEQHGASLHTLYSLCVPSNPGRRPGYVLVVKDSHGAVFGAYANEYFHPKDDKRFYGNGESFLWKIVTSKSGQMRFEAYPYTGMNDFVIYCTPRFLSMGGGDGHYGLWIDSDLLHGVSDRSLTFGNDILGTESKFDILVVEVWRIG